MSVNAIVRISFQSEPRANQAANLALVGHTQNRTGSGPFEKAGTGAYVVTGGSAVAVGSALAALGVVVSENAGILDFLSVTVVNV